MAFVFPVINSADAKTAGVGGGLEVTAKGHGLAGWNVDKSLRRFGCYPPCLHEYPEILKEFLDSSDF